MRDDYGKVFTSMYTGSMRGSGFAVYAVWAWIIAHKDETGTLEINPDQVADELGGDVQEVVDVLKALQSPDPKSRSMRAEGKRLVHIDDELFTYRVVNHTKYDTKGQDRTAYWKNYKRQKRLDDQETALSTPVHSGQSGMSNNSTHVAVAVAVPVVKPPGAALPPPRGRSTKTATSFEPPTLEMVRAHVRENKFHFDPDEFWNHHETKGWVVGRSNTKMQRWKSACYTFEKTWKVRNPESKAEAEPEDPTEEEVQKILEETE